MAGKTKKSALQKDIEAELSKPGKLKVKETRLKDHKQMNASEFKHIRTELTLTQAKLAEHLNTPMRTIQGYEQGQTRIPGAVALILRLMLRNSDVRDAVIGGETLNNYYRTKDKYVLVTLDTGIGFDPDRSPFRINNEIKRLPDNQVT